jgi:hypothetical protein
MDVVRVILVLKTKKYITSLRCDGGMLTRNLFAGVSMLAEGASREVFGSAVGVDSLVNRYICIPIWVIYCASFDVFLLSFLLISKVKIQLPVPPIKCFFLEVVSSRLLCNE